VREDLYIDEEELVKAANQIFGMANYYVATLEKYISILTDVKDESINDELVCGEIGDIISQARKHEIELQNLGEKFRNTVVSEIDAVEGKSTFSFPTEPDLSSIFSM
jgi:hypothetical protein